MGSVLVMSLRMVIDKKLVSCDFPFILIRFMIKQKCTVDVLIILDVRKVLPILYKLLIYTQYRAHNG